jgi:hypothetical protein
MTLSPSIQKALEQNKKLGRKLRRVAMPEIPPQRVIVPPPAPELSYREKFYAEEESRKTAERAVALGLEGREVEFPDALESALVEIDGIDERARRYQFATGKARRLSERGISLGVKVEPGTIEEIDGIAQLRGETRSTTTRYLIECGIALFVERRKRYEAHVLKQVVDGIDATEGVDAAHAVLEEMQPERYLDLASPFVLGVLDPPQLAGAPPEVKQVAYETLTPPEIPKPPERVNPGPMGWW